MSDMPNQDIAEKVVNGRPGAYRAMVGKTFDVAAKNGWRWFAKCGGIKLADNNEPRGFETRREAVEYAQHCQRETVRIYFK